jgi:hypothetical protein
MKKRFFSIVLVIAMVVSLFPAVALATETEGQSEEISTSDPASTVASGTCGENVNWVLDTDGVLTISGAGDMEGYSWTSAPWIQYCSEIVSIVIEDGVTCIGNYAFYGCSSLTSVEIPDSVTHIGVYAFYHCDSLTGIEIPDSVTHIGDYAFCGCSSLTSFSVDSNNPNYTDIDGILFNKAQTTLIQYPAGKSGESYSIPGGVTKISNYAFYGCTNLTDVYYTGSEASWNAISISIGNDPLTSATVHYAKEGTDIVASGTCGENLTWEFRYNGTLTISGTGDMENYSQYSNNLSKELPPLSLQTARPALAVVHSIFVAV